METVDTFIDLFSDLIPAVGVMLNCVCLYYLDKVLLLLQTQQTSQDQKLNSLKLALEKSLATTLLTSSELRKACELHNGNSRPQNSEQPTHSQ